MEVREKPRNAEKMWHYPAIPINQLTNLAGQADALRRLGDIYYLGLGAKVDYQRARHYYEKIENLQVNFVALQATAWVGLGNIYFFGYGVPKDNQRARQYYKQAENQQANLEAQAYAVAMLNSF